MNNERTKCILQRYFNYRLCTWFEHAEQLMINDYFVKRRRTNAIYMWQNKRGGTTKTKKTKSGGRWTCKPKRIITITIVNCNNYAIFQ